MNRVKNIQDEFTKLNRNTINQLVEEIQSQVNHYDTSIKVKESYSTTHFQINYLGFNFNFSISYESSGQLYLRGRKPFAYHRDYDTEKEMNKAYQYVKKVLITALQ